MREILFRGKRIDTREWVYGNLIQRNIWGAVFPIIRAEDNGYGNFKEWEVIPETVGQYIGLKDKNGKKIFEGDVLIFDGDKFVISWNDERCGFRMDYWMFDEQYDLSEFWPTSEVIGNIHDNPEVKE